MAECWHIHSSLATVKYSNCSWMQKTHNFDKNKKKTKNNQIGDWHLEIRIFYFYYRKVKFVQWNHLTSVENQSKQFIWKEEQSNRLNLSKSVRNIAINTECNWYKQGKKHTVESDRKLIRLLMYVNVCDNDLWPNRNSAHQQIYANNIWADAQKWNHPIISQLIVVLKQFKLIFVEIKKGDRYFFRILN